MLDIIVSTQFKKDLKKVKKQGKDAKKLMILSIFYSIKNLLIQNTMIMTLLVLGKDTENATSPLTGY